MPFFVDEENDKRDHLLANLKKEVKLLIELSVTCKFIHEDNSCFNSLCGTIENCIKHGLKKNLFKKLSTFNLLIKLSKECEAAKHILDICNQIEQNNCNPKVKLNEYNLADSMTNMSQNEITNYNRYSNNNTPPSVLKTYLNKFHNELGNYRYLWIKLAILNKSLMDIIDFLYKNSSKFYLPHALLTDPLDGEIFCSLLIGPCTLEYTRIKTSAHFNSDPNAEELLQRHKIQSQINHSSGGNINNYIIEPNTNANITATYMSNGVNSIVPRTPTKQTKNVISPKDYVESLHQNFKSQLIYGKNNKEKSISGYLSLHLDADYLILKWTPNELLNSDLEINCEYQKGVKRSCWKDSIQIEIFNISYLHCHQEQTNSSSSVILVAKDGVQYPPILFDNSNHLKQFLICLENGMQPNFKLDPASWETFIDKTNFSIVLKINILYADNNDQDVMNIDFNKDHPTNYFELSPISQHDQQNKNFMLNSLDYNLGEINVCKNRGDLKNLCDTMKNKIISRAFNGWLEYYRYTKNIKKNLVNLVELNKSDQTSLTSNIDSTDVDNLMDHYIKTNKKLDERLWETLLTQKKFKKRNFNKIIYEYGIEDANLRKKVWPYLLEFYTFDMTSQEIEAKYKKSKEEYQKLVAEWKIVEEYIHVKNESEKTPSSISSVQSKKKSDDDSGIYSDTISDVFSLSGSSSNLSDSSHFSPRSNSNLNSSKYRVNSQTPISITNVAPSTKETKFSLMLGEIAEDTTTNNDNTNKTSNIFSFFKAKNLFAKFKISSVSSEEKDNKKETDSKSLLPNIVSTKFDSEFIIKELSQFLVSNAIIKAVHELKLEEHEENAQNKSRSSVQSSNCLSPLSDIEETNTEIIDSVLENEGEKNNCNLSILATPRLAYNSTFRHNYMKKLRIIQPSLNRKKKNLKTIYKTLNNKNVREKPINTLLNSPSVIISSKPPLPSSSFRSNKELLELFNLNMHRIDKDVARCDRNHWYFTNNNLKKLQNIVYTYVWENLKVGYQQGMCDIVAPLLIVLDDEALAYSCYIQLMRKMSLNFIYSSEMDKNFLKMSSLIQILDNQLYEHIKKSSDYDQFYFCYRWFLLDFKREFVHDHVQNVWETIWCAKNYVTEHFYLFIATALIETYRDIIIDNNMEFTDMIKFFNEMAEKHNTNQVLRLARSLVIKLQNVINRITE